MLSAHYFIKHHPTKHHIEERSKYVRDSINILVNNLSHIYKSSHMGLQGCVNPTHVGLKSQHEKDRQISPIATSRFTPTDY